MTQPVSTLTEFSKIWPEHTLLCSADSEKLVLIAGEHEGKTFQSRQIVQERRRIEECLHEFGLGNFNYSAKKHSTSLTISIPKVKYVDWCDTYDRPLTLLEALGLEEVLLNTIKSDGEFRCKSCHNWSFFSLARNLSIIQAESSSEVSLITAANDEPKSTEAWIKSCNDLGYDRFFFDNQLLAGNEILSKGISRELSKNILLVLEALDLRSEQERLKTCLKEAKKRGNTSLQILHLTKNVFATSKSWISLKGALCRHCGTKKIEPTHRELPQELAEYRIDGVQLNQLRTIPLSQLNLSKSTQFSKLLCRAVEKFQHFDFESCPLWASSGEHRPILNLMNIIRSVKNDELLILDHLSLGLSDSEYSKAMGLLVSLTQYCRGILIIDRSSYWQKHFQAQPTTPIVADSPELIKYSRLSDIDLAEDSRKTKELIFVQAKSHEIHTLQQKLNLERPKEIRFIPRKPLEPAPNDTLGGYLGLNKIFAEMLVKTTAAKVHGLTAKKLLTLPLLSQSEFKFKDTTLDDYSNLSLTEILNRLTSIPEMKKPLEILVALGMGSLKPGSYLGNIRRSWIDQIKLLRKLLELPKATKLLIVEEPLVAMEAKATQELYSRFKAFIPCRTLVLVTSLDKVA